MKPKAYSLIRHLPPVRGESFTQGLQAAGFEVRRARPDRIEPGDLVLIWNRYGDNHEIAKRAERAGGVVLVAENGYIGPASDAEPLGSCPKFDLDGGMQPQHMIALARGAHNDDTPGCWPDGDIARWRALGITLAPWRAAGRHVVVCANRSFGTPGRIQPHDWERDVCERLRRVTDREIRVRSHPGTHAPKRALATDLADAWAMVIWHSSAGVHALVAGVPVICEAPAWSCRRAAGNSITEIEAPPMPERAPVFERLAWAQWSFAEIATGEPIRRLVEMDSA